MGCRSSGGWLRSRAPAGCLAAFAIQPRIEAVLEEPEEGLPGSAEFQDFVKDQSKDFLHAAAGVLLIAIPFLDETNRYADDELAAERLGHCFQSKFGASLFNYQPKTHVEKNPQ